MIEKKNLTKKKMALCENNCEFIEYKKDIKKVVCDCKVKKDFNNFDELNKEELFKKFSNYKKIVNIEIIKCYKLLFTRDGLISNIGSYIILSIILIHIICSFSFCIKGYNSFFKIINKLKKNNINENNIKQNKNNNKITRTNNLIKSPKKKKKNNSKKKNQILLKKVKLLN